MTQVAARESFELSPRWLLQDSWGYSIWRTWFRCKAHHTDHWRPGLHGRHRNAKTVSRQGSCLKPCCNLLPVSCFLLCQAYQWIYFQVKTIVKPGCSRDTLKAAISSMISVTHVLTVMSHPLNAELPLYHFNWAWITHCISYRRLASWATLFSSVFLFWRTACESTAVYMPANVEIIVLVNNPCVRLDMFVMSNR